MRLTIGKIHGTPARLGRAFHDGETEAGSAGLARTRKLGPVERLAQPLQRIGRHPGAVVLDGNHHRFPDRKGGEGDRAGVAGVAERVTNEIGERAGEQRLVGLGGEAGGGCGQKLSPPQLHAPARRPPMARARRGRAQRHAHAARPW